MVGDSRVGKTSILYRFISNKFNELENVTVGLDFGIRQIHVGNKEVKLIIWDTAGQCRYKSIVRSYFRGSAACLFVFDVSNAESFANITYWLNEAAIHAPETLVGTLVGNKCDLCRVVSEKDAKALAHANNLSYFETSAKNSEGVMNVFSNTVERVLD